MQQREWRLCGIERFSGKMNQHSGVFADAVKHHGFFELSNHLANDVDAFRFELLEVGKAVIRDFFWID